MTEQFGPNQNALITLPTHEAGMNETVEARGTQPHIQSREYFNYVLLDAVSRPNLYIPPPGREQLFVAELGCGHANVTNALLSFFSGARLSQLGGSVYYTGIDDNPPLVHAAQARINSFYGPVIRNINLQIGDARNLAVLSALIPNASDIVIVRHPDIINNRTVALDILRQGYRHMTSEGVMIVSTFDQYEINDVNRFFFGQVYLTGRTRSPISSYGDHYVSVIKKDPASSVLSLENGKTRKT